MVSSVNQSREDHKAGGGHQAVDRNNPSLLPAGAAEWNTAHGLGSAGTPPGLGISPDEERLLKKPRTTQEGTAELAVGPEIAQQVDQTLKHA
jgi:hypothetical protein